MPTLKKDPTPSPTSVLVHRWSNQRRLSDDRRIRPLPGNRVPNWLALVVFLIAIVRPVDARVADSGEDPVGLPQIGSFGFDESGMDRSVMPGNDYFRFANGQWLARTAIPAQSAGYDRMTVATALASARTQQLIEDAAKSKNAPGSIGDKIGLTYGGFMDVASIEAKGATPLKPYLDAIDAIQTPAALAAAFGRAGRQGIAVPFVFFVQQDLKNSSVYAGYVRQGGLGLPDRTYYLSTEPKFAEVRKQYLDYIGRLLGLAGRVDPGKAAERILALETAIARVQWNAADTRDVGKIYNPVPVASLPSSMPGVDWTVLLGAAGLGKETRLIAFEPSALSGEALLLKSVPLSTWKEYLAFHTVAAAAPYLSQAFSDADFAFNESALSGTLQQEGRAERGVQLVNDALGQAVGELYVARYFPPQAKAAADALVKDLVAAMDERIKHLDWMSDQTKAKAHAKLAGMMVKVGYPSVWRDYASLRVVKSDVAGNAFRAHEFEYERRVMKLGHAVDRAEWAMTPQTAGAYSSASVNDIVVPAAMFVAPNFDPNADAAINYGAIGVIIGHEITHNFDDRGARFDADGNLSEWWTPDDKARFGAATKKLVAQYSTFEPLPGVHVDGQLTLSENIADLGGLNIAYDAYRHSLHGTPAPVIDGFTGDQRFFLGNAQVNRGKLRDEALRLRLATDPHTPEQWRINDVRNVDAWYAAFGVKPGQTLFIAPAERIRIW
jgi:putative endopeptidase